MKEYDRPDYKTIVYYGPGMSGKTANLEYLLASMPWVTNSGLFSQDTPSGRLLFFDGMLAGWQQPIRLLTMPGAITVEGRRTDILGYADSVVFVASSSPHRLTENQQDLAEILGFFQSNPISANKTPVILQYNKRDLADALSVESLDFHLNRSNVPRFEAIAGKSIGAPASPRLGEGVKATFNAALQLII